MYSPDGNLTHYLTARAWKLHIQATSLDKEFLKYLQQPF